PTNETAPKQAHGFTGGVPTLIHCTSRIKLNGIPIKSTYYPAAPSLTSPRLALTVVFSMPTAARAADPPKSSTLLLKLQPAPLTFLDPPSPRMC
ncbi:MAG: hypothetical protein ABI618_16910, partial [Nitrospirota bacterium]